VLVLTGYTGADFISCSCFITYNTPTGPATVVSGPANLFVVTGGTPGVLVNLSSRAFVGTGDNIMIGGFYIVGSTRERC
jgi:hypothetical protein